MKHTNKCIDKNTNRLYIAYGSNLNIEQMKQRCPYAVPLGIANLEGYRLLFRGGMNAVATVEPMDGRVVPVLVWEITPRCEEALDRYEGWPHMYRKETVAVELGGKTAEVMVYIMNERYPYGLPGEYYLNVIKEGYASAGFDVAVLDKAMEESEATGIGDGVVSVGAVVSSSAKNCTLCGGKMVWENPHLPGHFHESSCNLEDWDMCHDCMVEHCTSTNCLGCTLGEYPDCRFLDMKRHYMDDDSKTTDFGTEENYGSDM